MTRAPSSFCSFLFCSFLSSFLSFSPLHLLCTDYIAATRHECYGPLFSSRPIDIFRTVFFFSQGTGCIVDVAIHVCRLRTDWISDVSQTQKRTNTTVQAVTSRGESPLAVSTRN